MKTIKYATLALSERDQIFLKSIIAIYNTRGNANWEKLETGQLIDALFVGKGADKRQFLKVSRNINIVISLDDNIAKEHGHTIYLNPPLRATELIEKLKQVENIFKQASIKPVKASKVNQTVNKLRLLQWPKAELISQDAAYRVLSALLSRRAMSLHELTAISKKSEEVCKAFIDSLITAGCAEYIVASSSSDNTINSSLNREPVSASKKGLLDKIRTKLGLFRR